jgi:uncharacterized membrane protein
MKWNSIFHALGALGCIGGIIGLHSHGWLVWQWPTIALLWIISSYANAWSVYRANQEKHILTKEKLDMIEELSKADLRTWEVEMKLAKANDQRNKK